LKGVSKWISFLNQVKAEVENWTMNNMTKVIRLQLLYFICLLIVLRGHSVKGFTNKKTGDVFVSEDESRSFDRAMNIDNTGDVSVSEVEVEVEAFNLAMNNDETGDVFVSEVEADAFDLSMKNSCAETFDTEDAIAACEAVSE
jgi:hypothetical protein